MSIKTPRLIRDRCGVYYFRLLVPADLRQTIGKLELRRSLRTKDAIEARLRALELSIKVEQFLTRTKITDFPHLLEPTPDVRKVLIANFQTGEFRADTPAEVKELGKLTDSVSRFHEALKISAEARKAAGNGLTAVVPSTRTGLLLKVAVKQYFNERAKSLKKTTLAKHRTVLNALEAAHGNVDVGELQQEDSATAYQSTLIARLEGSTVNDHVSILSLFFSYITNKTPAKIANPWKTRFVEGARNLSESYETFEPEELERIFNPLVYVRAMKLPDFFWGPLIALYTGARADEIASLAVNQIRQKDGVFYFQIVDGKTKNAPRRIPVHKALIQLGFLKYYGLVKEAGHDLLFPHVLPGKNGHKKNMTRKFGRLLDQCDVNIQHPLKVFHSFRHTVVTTLTGEGVNDGIKKTLVGHDIGAKATTHDDYIHRDKLPLQRLQHTINLLNFPIDLVGLEMDQAPFLEAAERRLRLRVAKSTV